MDIFGTALSFCLRVLRRSCRRLHLRPPRLGGRLQSAIRPQSLYLRALPLRWALIGRSSADIVWLFICPFAVDNYTRNKHKLQDLRDENPQFIALTKKPRPSSPIFWLCAQEEAGRPLLRRSPPRFGHAYASGSGSWAGWVCSAWANCSSRSASSACRAAAA